MGKIFDAIKKYEDFSFFSTPGHKGELNFFDTTEFPSLCETHIYDCMGGFPQNIVFEAEENAAKQLKVADLKFLTGGASIGIKAAIMAVKGDIIAEEKSHPAIFQGAQLARKKVHIIKNSVENGLRRPVSLTQIEKALNDFKAAGAVVLTSPDYYGLVTENAVLEKIKQSGKTLIVDSAHGAHFLFSDKFPLSPAHFADAAILSAHKTLNAYTQAAFLTANNKALFKKIKENLVLLGTTSPSYLFLGQLENAITDATNADYNALSKKISEITKGIPILKNDDFTRIVLRSSDFNKTDKEMLDYFIQNKIMPEKVSDGFLIFIITPKNKDVDLDRLKQALNDLNKR